MAVKSDVTPYISNALQTGRWPTFEIYNYVIILRHNVVKMASAPIESMIVEDKSEPEKPVDREKVSIIFVPMTKNLIYFFDRNVFYFLVELANNHEYESLFH
jgi:hypothetical protein